MSSRRTRIAPTPSGYLHDGNSAHFLCVADFAAEHDAAVTLRIDDVDPGRTRPEFVEDIFHVVTWLGLPVADGPSKLAEQAQHSQQGRSDKYWRVVAQLLEFDLAFVCECSRRDLVSADSIQCVRNCVERNLSLRTGQSCVRGRQVPEQTGAKLGDFVLWRREGFASYGLVALVDDVEMGVTDVVRGADLLSVSAIQKYLSAQLGLTEMRYYHHELVEFAGQKLSKSQQAPAVQRSAANLSRLKEIGNGLAETLVVLA